MKKRWLFASNYKDAIDPEDDFWWEDCWSEDHPSKIIERFNNTLRPGEQARILVIALELEEENKNNKPHNWKKSSLVTQMASGGFSYDAYKCSDCKAKGKRFGLSDHVTPNRKNQVICKGS